MTDADHGFYEAIMWINSKSTALSDADAFITWCQAAGVDHFDMIHSAMAILRGYCRNHEHEYHVGVAKILSEVQAVTLVQGVQFIDRLVMIKSNSMAALGLRKAVKQRPDVTLWAITMMLHYAGLNIDEYVDAYTRAEARKLEKEIKAT